MPRGADGRQRCNSRSGPADTPSDFQRAALLRS
jgi:hypothetical protein